MLTTETGSPDVIGTIRRSGLYTYQVSRRDCTSTADADAQEEHRDCELGVKHTED